MLKTGDELVVVDIKVLSRNVEYLDEGLLALLGLPPNVCLRAEKALLVLSPIDGPVQQSVRLNLDYSVLGCAHDDLLRVVLVWRFHY